MARIPVPVTIELLQYGKERFEIHCAACRGVAGDGESEVARNMTLRPPSLVDRVQAFRPAASTGSSSRTRPHARTRRRSR